MAHQLPITNIINISVSQASPGIGNYNVSNIGLFTDEAPNLSTFGSLGYASYLEPTQVGVDFGTDSKTYAMAVSIFSQQPNILNGSGQLIVILMINAIQHLAFSGVAASGSFKINYDGDDSSLIAWNDPAATIQAALRASVVGLEHVIVTGSIASQSLNIQMAGLYAPLTVTTNTNTLATSVPAAVTITITTPTAAEDLDEAISRTASLVQYFGVIADEVASVLGSGDILAAAAVVQALNKMMLIVSNDSADINPGGLLDQLRTGSLTQSRGLYYGDSDKDDCLAMMAAYAGRGFSTNFTGSNTTSTMHLKVLAGIEPDPTLTQTQLDLAKDAGADTYPSLQGVPGVFCSGGNFFFDQVYNLRWLVGALQVAGFNYLAQSSTKIPQTESGMDGLKGAYRNICEQAVTNEYSAPGTWTSPVLFGNPSQLISNVAQRGYYIYSVPISQQNVADRQDRKAPLIQIALKEAGSIQSSNVLVSVNA
jgi:hypothetical protein